MELMSSCIQSTTAWCLLFTLLVLGISFSFIKSRDGELPPGPFSWPIVGCMFSLRRPLHRYYAELAKKHGPVIYLKIGMAPYVVVNNSEMAKEVLQVYDVDFAYKPDTPYFRHFSFGNNDMAIAPYGPAWRRLRRISNAHLFSPASLNATASYRKSEMATAIRSILQLCKDGNVVNLLTLFHEFTCNVMCLTLFGKKIEASDSHSASSVVELTDRILGQLLDINIGEFIPALEWLDLHGVEHRMKHELMPQLKSLLAQLIEQHRQHKAQVEAANQEFKCKDFTDVLISLDKDNALSDICTMGLLTDMITAGIEPLSGTLEWAMAEIISNPNVMLKAQEEIDKVVGKTCLVEESDVPELPYMQAIVKETLRLHPPAPLVLHYNPQPASIAGYKIPARTRVFVNVWAIGHDPANWTQPEEFQPERFLGSEITMGGHYFELIPFSAGRRVCAGYPLAIRSVPFVLATLLQAFNWSPPAGQGSVSLEEAEGWTCKPSTDLIAAASPRLNESLYA